MIQNFGKKITSKFTFSDLNNFIEHCTSDIHGSLKTFHLQSLEMNKLFFETCRCQEELRFFHKKVILANCVQTEIERNIEMLKLKKNAIGNEIAILESDIFHVYSCSRQVVTLDTFRKNTYALAESIYSKLNNLEAILDQIETCPYSLTANSSFDFFSVVLRCFLRQLENIEIKVHQLRDKLNHVSSHQKHFLQILNHKEYSL